MDANFFVISIGTHIGSFFDLLIWSRINLAACSPHPPKEAHRIDVAL